MQIKSLVGLSLASFLAFSSASANAGWVKTNIKAFHTMSNGDVAIKIGPLRQSATITCERKEDFTILRSDVNFEQNLQIVMAAQISGADVQLLDAGNCTTIPGWNVGIVNQIMVGDW